MITDEQYQQAAALIGCTPAAIKAVKEVEAPAGGFLPNGDIRILFEPHVFWKELKAIGIEPVESGICYPEWGELPYGKESLQMERLARAMEINSTAALKSASWGLFQIMGNNFRKAGYLCVEDMVEDYKKGESQQLASFVNYLKSTAIARHLVNKNWEGFALAYNGTGYKKNNYDRRLAGAFLKYS